MGGLLHLVQRGGDWAGPQPAQAPPRCTKCNSPPINSQCTNFVLFDVALQLPLESKGLMSNVVMKVQTQLEGCLKAGFCLTTSMESIDVSSVQANVIDQPVTNRFLHRVE